ncbi:phosphoenolpyruvate--protein phosphotransferase [Photobacterium sagamiensis]|uniref:phosphoenolpyruvate--protein phosphotransferase n=1 Tax=Photobacterium sagamiensis TaxID=2910241 RepID=UPI003D14375F
MLSFEFICVLPNGVHARPANELELRTTPFSANITLINHSKQTRADAKSVLSLVSADITEQDRCELQFVGDDQLLAFDALKAFIDHEFADCDEVLPSAVSSEAKRLPVSLAQAKPEYLRGRPISAGMGEGKPVVVGAVDLHRLADGLGNGGSLCMVQIEAALLTGLDRLLVSLEEAFNKADDISCGMLEAHLKIARDSSFKKALLNQQACAHPVEAIANASDQLRSKLLASSSRYLQERALDIEDICIQLAEQVVGESIQAELVLTQPSILVAQNLTPSQLLSLPREYVKGMVLEQTGETSHTVILARSFAIPVLTATDNAVAFVAGCERVILDAEQGVLVRSPNQETDRFYQLERHKAIAKQARLAPFRNGKGRSKDGVAMEIAANIAIGSEAVSAFDAGAEGIGLFRTEMLFMERSQPPSEQEQYQIYAEVLQAAEGRRVIIRTLDIGGDKPLDYLGLPEEENPFLGYRAVRIYPEFIELFRQQARALLRASHQGPLDIMVPMVSTLEEVQWLHQQFSECEQALKQEDVDVGHWRLGIMVEVPSTLFLVERIAPWIDFISIGSNDLTQYFMACDRGNDKVGYLYNHLQPGFIQLLKEIVQRAKAVGLETGLCGEMAADPQALPLLLAMGLDEISMASPKIAHSRAMLSNLTQFTCQQLLEEAIAAPSVAAVERLLSDCLSSLKKPEVLAPELVLSQLKAGSKAEVIKALTDNLELHERVSCGTDVEHDIWAREEVFSTALGFSFAIPHCKSPHVRHNSVSVAQLAEPVCWNEADDVWVSTVIMLTVDEQDAQGSHMQLFSRLARKLIHKPFREQLAASPSGEQTVALLHQHLIEQAA